MLSINDLWIPIQWSLQLTTKARADGLIKSDCYLSHIFDTCANLNTTLRIVWLQSWINIPLAYTQVWHWYKSYLFQQLDKKLHSASSTLPSTVCVARLC